MRVLHVSHSDQRGGAARAAWRLHQALLAAGLDSRMLVLRKTLDDPRIHAPAGWLQAKLARVRPLAGKLLMSLQNNATGTIRSPGWLPSGLGRTINQLDPDIVNLHWLGREALSVAEIGRIRPPMVWTMHDMWTFCGAEHYTTDDPAARWRQGYQRQNRAAGGFGPDLDRWTWNRKKRDWLQPINLVSPSHWLADCARNSKLAGKWPVTTIPNPLDTGLFCPGSLDIARARFNLPRNRKIILFSAADGVNDQRKGFDLLQSALTTLALRPGSEDWHCLIVGKTTGAQPVKTALPATWTGQLEDDSALVHAYQAADIMVIPSRQDNLPQTGTEAQACGCPVVAFNVGGLADIVVHRETGYLATPFDPDDLAAGIESTLQLATPGSVMSAAARNRAEQHWSSATVAAQYQQLYLDIIRQRAICQPGHGTST